VAGAGELQLTDSNNTAIRTPDTPLWKAIAYTAKRVGEAKGAHFSRTRAFIEQKAIAGELCIWGRKQLDADPEWVDSMKFAIRSTPIPSEYWLVSKLAPYCTVEPVMFGAGVADVPCTQEADKDTWPKKRNSYADLQVDWQQVTGCWAAASTKGINLVGRRKKRKLEDLSEHERAIWDVLTTHKTGLRGEGLLYCSALDRPGIRPPWKGCPQSYRQAFNDPDPKQRKRWRARIYDEKHRISKLLPKKRIRSRR
jgi:hypothetical protein